MQKYIVYNIFTGKILRTGGCSERDFEFQTNEDPNLEVMLGSADDSLHKIDLNTFKIVNKTQAEIDADLPPEKDPDDKRAYISYGELKNIIQRIKDLEDKIGV